MASSIYQCSWQPWQREAMCCVSIAGAHEQLSIGMYAEHCAIRQCRYMVLMQFAPIITDFVMLSLLGERSDMYKDAKHSLATKELIRREDRHRIEDLFEHYDHDNRFAEHISRSLLSGGRGVSFMFGCSLRPCHTSACARARAQHTHTHTNTHARSASTQRHS